MNFIQFVQMCKNYINTNHFKWIFIQSLITITLGGVLSIIFHIIHKNDFNIFKHNVSHRLYSSNLGNTKYYSHCFKNYVYDDWSNISLTAFLIMLLLIIIMLILINYINKHLFNNIYKVDNFSYIKKQLLNIIKFLMIMITCFIAVAAALSSLDYEEIIYASPNLMFYNALTNSSTTFIWLGTMSSLRIPQLRNKENN